ncbi:MAG: HNH endonuclease [Lysinibacillus sp.]
MAIGRSIGKGAGKLAGGLIGGTIKLAGKAVGSKYEEAGDWIEDVGEGVKKSSAFALENAGQFIDGAAQGAYGLVKDDPYYKEQGLQDLKQSSTRTVKAVGSSLHYVGANIGTTAKGFAAGDKEQGIEGLKNLGKVVAVSALAVGVLDLIDSPEAEAMDTRNDHLAGLEHPETGVPFLEKTVELPDGSLVEGSFPVFESSFDVMLNEELYLASDDTQFSIANETLANAIAQNPGIAAELNLSQADLQSLAAGQTPEGYTWHHHEQPGRLQLVDEQIHNSTGHTGGRSLWGGGSAYR